MGGYLVPDRNKKLKIMTQKTQKAPKNRAKRLGPLFSLSPDAVTRLDRALSTVLIRRDWIGL